MKKYIFLTICAFIFCLTNTGWADQTKNINIESYTISPLHSYKHITLVPRNALAEIGSECKHQDHLNSDEPDETGLLYLNKDTDNAFTFCTGENDSWIPRRFGPSYWTYLSDLWHLQFNPAQTDTGSRLSFFEYPFPYSAITTTSALGLGTQLPPFTLSIIGNGGILAKGDEWDSITQTDCTANNLTADQCANNNIFQYACNWECIYTNNNDNGTESCLNPDTNHPYPDKHGNYDLFFCALYAPVKYRIENDIALNSNLLHLQSSTKDGFPLLWWYPQKGAFRAQYMRIDDISTKTVPDGWGGTITVPQYDFTPYYDLWGQDPNGAYLQETDGNFGYYSTAFGDSNIAAGRASFVAGVQNKAWNHLSSIIGGTNNTIQTKLQAGSPASYLNQRFGSTIIGGTENLINGPHNLIGGGQLNRILGANSSAIAGGCYNTIQDYDTANSTYDDSLLNASLADETHSTIFGGSHNTNNGRQSTIVGGSNNTINSGASYSAIMGGQNHMIDTGASYSAIVGGTDVTLSGSYSTVLTTNTVPSTTITSDHSLLIRPGGTAPSGKYIVSLGPSTGFSGDYSVKLNNHQNATVNSNYAVVYGGGASSSINTGSDYAVAINKGADTFIENADHSFVTEGAAVGTSTTPASYSVVHGGKATGQYSYNFIQYPNCSSYRYDNDTNNVNNADRSFVFAVCPDHLENIQDNDFIIYGTYDHDNNSSTPNLEMKVGIGTTAPTKTLEVNGGFQAMSFKIGDATLPQGEAGDPNYGILFRNSSGGEIFYNDIAEIFPAHEQVAPGDILSIAPETPDKLTKSKKAYDPLVIGVVSSVPAMTFKGQQVTIAPKTPTEKTDQPPMALAGRTMIKVCQENGPITRGDLLTTSSTPGIAMKASNTAKARHAIIAKALQDFNGEKKQGAIIGLLMVR